MKRFDRTRFWIAAFYAVAFFAAPLVHAQWKPAAPTVTVYQDPG